MKKKAELIPLPGGMSVLHLTPEGTCPECAVKHGPEEPHDVTSMAYQYYFYGKNGGRWPTWEDAMAHCTDEKKGLIRRVLGEMGIDPASVMVRGER